MMATRLLPLQNFQVFDKPDLEAFTTFDVGCSQFHLWLRQAQRDHGLISDKEMNMAEMVIGRRVESSQARFNPFTGRYDRKRASW